MKDQHPDVKKEPPMSDNDFDSLIESDGPFDLDPSLSKEERIAKAKQFVASVKNPPKPRTAAEEHKRKQAEWEEYLQLHSARLVGLGLEGKADEAAALVREMAARNPNVDAASLQPVGDRLSDDEDLEDGEAAVKYQAPPLVPELSGQEIPHSTFFVEPVGDKDADCKKSKSDFHIANAILARAQRQIGPIVATSQSSDPHTPLYAYDGGCYHQLPASWLYDCIKRYDGAVTMFQAMNCKAVNKQTGEKLPIPDDEKWHATPRNISAVTKLVTLESISRQNLKPGASFFRKNAPSAVFLNGSLVYSADEKRFQWVGHHPDHRARHRFEIDFQHDLTPVHTVAALRYSLRGQPETEIDKCVEVLRAAIGISLLGCAKLVKRGVWNLGRGRDGKGLYAEVINHILPKQHRSAVQPASIADKVIGKASALRLMDSRVNIVSEVQTMGGGTAQLKAAIVCEAIEARAMRDNPDEDAPEAMWIVDSNYPLPQVVVDPAWRDRWVMVRFLHSVPEQYRIVGLGERLAKLEYREIVCWAIDGALDLLANGARWDLPSCHHEVMAAWAAGAGLTNVACFVEEMIEKGVLKAGAKGSQVMSRKDFYGAWDTKSSTGTGYLAWCKENGYQPRSIVSHSEFKTELEAVKGIRLVKRNRKDWVLLDASAAPEPKTETQQFSRRVQAARFDLSRHEVPAATQFTRPRSPEAVKAGVYDIQNYRDKRHDDLSDGFDDGIPDEAYDGVPETRCNIDEEKL